MVGAGNREVVRRGGGHILWQAHCFLRVRRVSVDVQIFVVGAGNRKVASCGGGECRCDIGIGVWAGVVWRGRNRRNCLAELLDVFARMGLPA